MLELKTVKDLRRAAYTARHSDVNHKHRDYLNELYTVMTEVADHLHELVLGSNSVVYRLMGFAIDRDDNYVIVKDIGGDVTYSSMVGGIGVPLKPLISDRNYRNMDDLFYLNDKTKIVEMFDKELLKEILAE